MFFQVRPRGRRHHRGLIGVIRLDGNSLRREPIAGPSLRVREGVEHATCGCTTYVLRCIARERHVPAVA